MLLTAGDVHCLDGENNTVLFPKKKQSCIHHHPLALKGHESQGLICKKKKENYCLRRCRNTHPSCLAQERKIGAE